MKPRRRLRTRLFVAMAAIAIGVLAVSGFVTLSLARRGTVRTAQQQLRDKAPGVADQLEVLGRRLRTRRAQGQGGAGVGVLLANVLRVSGGGLVTVTPDGTITEGIVGLGNRAAEQAASALELPAGLSTSDLDAHALLAGQEQTGQVGGSVFVAEPLTASAGGTPVLVLTQDTGVDSATRARGFFLIGSALAIGLAMLVANFAARRLTRPLAAMGDTARSIAGGDLSARVELGRHPDDELADLARTLNGMASDLEQARGLERAFILSVSHDLRTPLTSIRGYTEALLDGTIPASEEQRHAATVIAAESRRLERLVTDLLDLARLDARQFSLHPRAVDAADVVRTALDGFRPAAQDLGVAIEIDGPAPLPVRIDPDRLAQIVANLVENALKYARSRIVVEMAETAGTTIELRVRDDGPGIPPADVPRVFDRLFTSRAAPGRSVGTGLGLAIVHELTVAMGGRTWVDGDPPAGDGACFVVRLPTAAG